MPAPGTKPVAKASVAGVVEFELKDGFREVLQQDIDTVLQEGILSSGRAAKLRGKLGWSASGTYGRCARGGQAPLVRRQYFDTVDVLDEPLKDSLRFHSLLACVVQPRQVQVLGAVLPPVRIYSDASYEPDTDLVAGVGFVVFDAASAQPPVGMAARLAPQVLQLFDERHQQITPCEALLSVIVPCNVPHLLVGRDLIWYIDNQAACQILTKGASSAGDLCFIASLAHLLYAKLSCRVYFEYIESNANPADGLSRDGLDDAWTFSQGWSLLPAIVPDLVRIAASSLAAALTAL
ncbi:unnamed protein product [Effrenium voratum]|nr:unnamed protein product [Effrenium voratum]